MCISSLHAPCLEHCLIAIDRSIQPATYKTPCSSDGFSKILTLFENDRDCSWLCLRVNSRPTPCGNHSARSLKPVITTRLCADTTRTYTTALHHLLGPMAYMWADAQLTSDTFLLQWLGNHGRAAFFRIYGADTGLRPPTQTLDRLLHHEALPGCYGLGIYDAGRARRCPRHNGAAVRCA